MGHPLVLVSPLPVASSVHCREGGSLLFLWPILQPIPSVQQAERSCGLSKACRRCYSTSRLLVSSSARPRCSPLGRLALGRPLWAREARRGEARRGEVPACG
jgi:hypothetical protein